MSYHLGYQVFWLKKIHIFPTVYICFVLVQTITSSYTISPFGLSFSLMLRNHTVCDVCGLRSPHLILEISDMIYLHKVLRTQQLVLRKCSKSPDLDVKGTIGTANLNIFYNLQSFLVSLLIDAAKQYWYQNRCIISIDINIMHGLYKFGQPVTIYIVFTQVFLFTLWKKTSILLQWWQNYWVWND